jgi:putative phosphoribosyl transferase
VTAAADGPRAYRDRADAGAQLAEHLGSYAGRADVVVLGLPRGGVPVAAEVARALRAPLDVFCVRKLGVPGDEELAMGAIATGGVVVLNEGVVAELGVPEDVLAEVAAAEREELERRDRAYRGRPPRHAGRSRRTPTRWCARSPRKGSGRSADGTRTSGRRATTRSGVA